MRRTNYNSSWNMFLVGLTFLVAGVVSISTNRVNQTAALEKCGGKLAPYYNLQTLMSRTKNLQERESFWISGRVKFSPFITWYGCYQRNALYQPVTIDYNNVLYSCSSTCFYVTDPPIYFVAIYQHFCYCLTVEQKETLVALPMKTCHITGTDLLKPGYRHDTDYFMVYEINPYKGDIQRYNYRQCLKIDYFKSSHDIRTDSCFSMNQSGFVCMSLKDSLTGCSEQQSCEFRAQTTWTEAFDLCKNIYGVLINSADHNRFKMFQNGEYWTGLFRVFSIMRDILPSITTTTNHTTDVCLSVTKFKNELFYDPDECSAHKFYLCETDEMGYIPKTNTSEEKDMVTIKGETVTRNTDQEILPCYSQKYKTSIYIWITASTVLTSIAVVCAVLWRRKASELNKLKLQTQPSVRFQDEDTAVSNNPHIETNTSTNAATSQRRELESATGGDYEALDDELKRESNYEPLEIEDGTVSGDGYLIPVNVVYP